MSVKRKHEDSLEELDEFNLASLCDSLRRKGGQDLAAKAILKLARNAGLSLTDLKRAKESHPTFASARWEDVALKFSLDPSRDAYQLASFSVHRAFLPPSLHKDIMVTSAQWLDVYQERGARRKETARTRVMDAWYIPVCALFKGRVVDLPEPETSRGRAEHVVYMSERVILIVIELKLELKNERDHAAQVLLDLASAYELNSSRGFEPQPVFAVLTDLRIFQFYRYDGVEFSLADDVYVTSRSRAQFLEGMGDVTETLFSLILQGYISTLRAIKARATKQKHSSDLKPGSPTESKGLDTWTQALLKAEEAQDVLAECSHAAMQEWEDEAWHGLHLLDQSVSLLPKIGSNTDWNTKKLQDEIDKIMVIKRKKACGRIA